MSLDENTTPTRYSDDAMADKEKPRSIRFPESIWNALDRDAVEHKRSSVKHLEFLLTAYYKGKAPQLDLVKLRHIKGEEPKPELTYDNIMRELDELGVTHIEFADGERTPEALADVRDAIKKHLPKRPKKK